MSCRELIGILALAVCVVSAPAAAETFTGRVSNAVTGDAVPGARVEIDGSGVAGATDRKGEFELARAPQDGESLVVRAAGYAGVTLSGAELQRDGRGIRIRLDPAPGGFRESVVVTGTRTSTPLAEVPGAVSVLEREDLAATPSSNLADAVATSAGIHQFTAFGNPLDFGMNARGFTGGGTSSYLLVLVDGVPVNDLDTSLVDWNLVPLDRVERIEVQRGPASAAYGDNALGGVVHVFTTPVPDGGTTSLEGGGGSFGERHGELYHAGRSGRVGYGVSLARRELDGYRDRSGYESQVLTGRLAFELGDRTELMLSSVNNWLETESPGPITRQQVEQDRRQAGYAFDGWDQDRNLLSATIRHAWPGGARLTAGLAHRIKDARNLLTLPLEVQIGDMLFPSFDAKQQTVDARTTSLDARIERTWSGGATAHRLIAGVEAGAGSFDSLYREVDDSGQSGAPIADGDGSRNVYAVYLQDQIELPGPLDLLVGVRYDRFEDEFDERLADDGDPATVMRLDSDADELSPKLGLTWEYAEGGSLYLQALWGFRAPTVEQLFDQRQPFDSNLSNAGLEPQRVRSYEAGLRQALGEHAGVDLAVYWLRARNEIEFDPATFSFGNIGRSRHRGAELTLTGRTGPLGTFLTYTFQQAEHDVGPAAGRQIKYVPEHLGSVGVRYGEPAGWSGSAVYRVVGSQYIDDENATVLGSYGTLDLQAGYRFRSVELFLRVLNALDERYSTNAFLVPRFTVVPGPDIPTTTVFYPSPDRSIRGGLRWTSSGNR